MRRTIVPIFLAFVTLATPARAIDVPASPDLNIPPAEALAAELGYKPADFQRAVDDFATSLSQGSRGQAFKRFCARDEESCRLITDFHAPGGLGVLELVFLTGLPDMHQADVLAALIVFRLLYLLIPFAMSLVVVLVFEKSQFLLRWNEKHNK